MWPFSKPVKVDNDWRDTVRSNIMTEIISSALFPNRRRSGPQIILVNSIQRPEIKKINDIKKVK
jgi:hypothetical protein